MVKQTASEFFKNFDRCNVRFIKNRSKHTDGWKYFDLLNLNELFHIKFLEKKEEGLIGELNDEMDSE